MRHNGSDKEPQDTERHDMQTSLASKEHTLRGDDVDLIFPNLFPLFGGVEPTTPPATTPPAATPPTTDAPAGGATPPATDDKNDPVKKLLGNPDAVAALLQQSSNVQSQLTDALAKLSEFEQKEQAAAAANQSKEEQQATQITRLETEVGKRDLIIAAKVLENAVAKNTQFEWHNVNDVISKIDQNTVKTTIDIDKGIAEVEGVDVELKRIASEFPYLVSKDKTKPDETQQPPAGTQPPVRQRGTGNPPRPPAAPQDKAARRESVMKKFPTLMAGMNGRP